MTRRPRVPRALLLSVALAAAAVALLPAAQSPAAPNCKAGEAETVEVGIVKAIGCWTKSEVRGQTVVTAAWKDQDVGVDLNGFILTGPSGGGLQINTDTREVKSVQISGGTNLDLVQLNSRGWPGNGLFEMGKPIKLDFVAPEKSGLLLEDLTFGSNSIGRALGGLSPVGTVETPVRLEEDGTGSMDLTVALAGIFTLKGKPQSVTVSLPTSSGNGTKLDGFELKLKEIDAIKGFDLNDLEAFYSAAKKELGGSMNVKIGPMQRGVGFGFKVVDGTITSASVSVHGTKIPIGAPPGGFITDIAGGFESDNKRGDTGIDFDGWCKSQGYENVVLQGPDHGPNAFANWKCHKGSTYDGIDVDKACQHQSGNPRSHATAKDPNNAYSWICVEGGPSQFTFIANANLGADFGPEIPTPFGEIAPISVDAGMDLGYTNEEMLIRIHGGVQVFRLPVGDVYLAIHTSSGVEFGAGLGIGFPSYRNNENDPFYIGARVDGWVGKGKFQLEGKGRVALIGVKIFDGRLLVNDRVAGACWTIVGVPGGVYYRYGEGGVHDFGIGCGLDDFREKFPAEGARVSAPRSLRLSGEEQVLRVKGAGGSPRFALRSDDGRVIRTPAGRPSELGADHAVFINEFTDTTTVVLRRPRGRWTVVPESGSKPITSLKAARRAPRERVRAQVRGRGLRRTLVWNSRNRPHTRLVFTEVLPDGHEVPILDTGRARGSHRFRVAPNSFGRRRLRVVVVHGQGSVQSAILHRYRINHARRLRAPKKVSAWRHEHRVAVRWSGVRRAHGYLVQVATKGGRRVVTSFVRRVSSWRRSIAIPRHPGGGRAVARVSALNSEGRLGPARKRSFALSPPASGLPGATRASATSVRRSGGRALVVTSCPEGGHCQVRVSLRLNGRRVASARYQQTPDTFHLVRLRPRDRSVQRAIRRGQGRLRAAVSLGR